ncbi:MAG: nitroreductase family protein [Methanomicrobiales archaeon]|jgi:nitroreductase|nr:nitroreductase family protein [Methanomicrobiales archaeon]
MDIFEFSSFLCSRRSVRHYTEDDITNDVLSQILAPTSTIPSAGVLESWDAVIVRDRGMKEALYDASFSQEHILFAPVIAVVCANYIRSMSRFAEEGIMYAIEEATIAATYIMLAAHAAGISSCWTGGFDAVEVREILLLPTHLRPVVLLTLGYASSIPGACERIENSDHFHKEYWDAQM